MVFLALLIYKRRAAWGIPLLGVVVTLVSWATKSFFQHPRPYSFFEEKGLLSTLEFIPGVRINKGLTSFPSGHTMAAFALFSFLTLCFPRKTWLSIVCFAAAMLVGVSRMYLVQHFFTDVYSGAVIGISLGILAYLGLNKTEQKIETKV